MAHLHSLACKQTLILFFFAACSSSTMISLCFLASLSYFLFALWLFSFLFHLFVGYVCVYSVFFECLCFPVYSLFVLSISCLLLPFISSTSVPLSFLAFVIKSKLLSRGRINI